MKAQSIQEKAVLTRIKRIAKMAVHLIVDGNNTLDEAEVVILTTENIGGLDTTPQKRKLAEIEA